jgi:hypothetical protein
MQAGGRYPIVCCLDPAGSIPRSKALSKSNVNAPDKNRTVCARPTQFSNLRYSSPPQFLRRAAACSGVMSR